MLREEGMIDKKDCDPIGPQMEREGACWRQERVKIRGVRGFHSPSSLLRPSLSLYSVSKPSSRIERGGGEKGGKGDYRLFAVFGCLGFGTFGSGTAPLVLSLL